MRSVVAIGQSIQNAISLTPALAPPPRLSRLSSTWRYLAALLISTVVWTSVADGQFDQRRWLFVVDPVLGLVTFVLMHYRRRWPLPIAVIATVITSVSAAATGPAIMITASVATRRRARELFTLLVLSIPTSLSYYWLQPDSDNSSLLVQLTFGLILVVAVLAIGMYVGARRELVATLRERAERAEQEQALRISQAQSSERARIAREMHDVLAHRISRIAMHAGALAYRTDLDPETTRQAAEVIQADAHGALTELRSVLGVLREPAAAPDEPQRPQPTLADLGRLVAEARAGGMNVSLEQAPQLSAELPDHIGRNAFRIVQEGLTNAAKHAPGTRVLVHVDRAGEELAVEVRNRLPVRPVNAPPGSGLGLIGLSERTALAGGRLEHGRVDGDFVVRAWLPYE